MSSFNEKKSTLNNFFSRKKNTGRGSRPSLEKFNIFKNHFENNINPFEPNNDRDANQGRLVAAMNDARKSYRDTGVEKFEQRAGFINEARQYNAVLDKYNRMSQNEKDDRVYLPQMNIFHNDKRDSYRRPDMIKLKRNHDQVEQDPFKISVVEFKSNKHNTEQRNDTARLLSSQDKVRGSFLTPSEAKEDEIYKFELPVTSFKTRFTGKDPNMNETSNRIENGKIKGTDIGVSNKSDLTKK